MQARISVFPDTGARRIFDPPALALLARSVQVPPIAAKGAALHKAWWSGWSGSSLTFHEIMARGEGTGGALLRERDGS
ncbi:MAG: hypothetical protein ABSB15_28145 [Bryobacteraceae bacterium]